MDETVYYLVKANPPTAEDMLSAKQKGSFAWQDDCIRASLSCGLSVEYIVQLRHNVPRLKQYLVASAVLDPADGKIKQTGNPGHHSLWLRLASLQVAPKKFEVLPS